MVLVDRNSEIDEQLLKEKADAFQEFIQKKKLKTTRQRNTIVRVFFTMRGHISVEELLVEVKRVNPKIGYATVYRTLHLLVESGLVDERRFGDGLARYEGRSEVEHHDHMICLDCGKITEFFDPQIREIQERLARDNGHQIFKSRLELYGVCTDKASCQQKQKTKAGTG